MSFLQKFREKNSRAFQIFTATQFKEVWDHFDSDGNGYIEQAELDSFLKDFIASGVHSEACVSEAGLELLKEEILLAFDDNEDGRIEAGELVQILPVEEQFLYLFQRERPLPSSAEFMRIWKKFDSDHSGFIEANELRDFLNDLLPNESADRLDYYVKTMLELFDSNKDGKLQLSEMARLLPVKSNFLSQPLFRRASSISEWQVEKILKTFDTEGKGKMSSDELDAFIKDLLDLTREEYDVSKVESLKKKIFLQWDTNQDGFIDLDELRQLFKQQRKLCEIQTKSDIICVKLETE
ncbi:Calbindin [Cichlidogyrus casuarinus]|uniref:Calbindin n=1 Tax=Cichlidogyrus casuarinus TaxID=1844966 RepID=A0ABD2Q4K3_9PLAT